MALNRGLDGITALEPADPAASEEGGGHGAAGARGAGLPLDQAGAGGIAPREWRQAVAAMNPAALRQELKRRGCTAQGNKKELKARLLGTGELEAAAPPRVDADDAGAGACGGGGTVVASLEAARALLRGRNSVHLKGFGDGMASVHAVVDDALALILPYDAVVWDGDPLKACGFTALVEAYLAAHPTGVAVAFKPRDAVKTLLRSWQGVIGRWPGRVKVVPVDVRAATDALGLRDEVARSCAVLPGWARTYYALGRAAMRVSGSARVVALGGGGIAAREAEAGIGEGVAWTVFALGRGKKESHASLCDMAAAHPQVTLIRGKDPDEALAFSGGCPPTKTPPRPARTGPPSPATAARRAKKPPSAGHHGTGHGAAAADAGGAGARPRNTRKPRSRVQGSWAA